MKKFLFGLLVFGITMPSISAEEISGSWATRNEGVLKEEIAGELTGRYVLDNSLYEADVIANNYKDNSTFTGVGHYNSITYYFHKVDENNELTHYGRLVNNPDNTIPDLRLTEVTWGNDKSTWSAEGVAIYAVDYNGTGEEKLIGYAYNKVAEKRAKAFVSEEYPDGYILPQVEGAKIEYIFADNDSQARDLYDALIYFNDEFESAAAIKLVDITDDIKFLGGDGQQDKDGYDLDAIYGYRIIMTSVKQDVTYVIENNVEQNENNSVLYNGLETYSNYTILANMFTKEDYTFVAWATEGSGNVYGSLTKEDIPNYSENYDYYAPEYVINLDKSYTFYGVWEEIIEDEKPSCECDRHHHHHHDKLKPNCGHKHHPHHSTKPRCGNEVIKPNYTKPNCSCNKINSSKPSCDKKANKKDNKKQSNKTLKKKVIVKIKKDKKAV